jgi:hypothetical protein
MTHNAEGSDDAPTEAQVERESLPMLRADLLAGLFFIVLGAAILYGSWTMPRLEVRRIHPMTVPGLVPGLLSFALIVCGSILALRSWRAPTPGGWSALGQAVVSEAARRALVVVVLVLIYTLGLVGLVPFWAATAAFVFAFIVIFETWLGTVKRPLVATLLWAAGLAVVASAAVTLVFERAFLVRLP